MDDVGQVGLLAPPEDPQLLGVGLDLAAPHAQQVGLHAAHEAAQDRVVLGRRRDHRAVLAAAAEAVAAPFDARQLSLQAERERGGKVVVELCKLDENTSSSDDEQGLFGMSHNLEFYGSSPEYKQEFHNADQDSFFKQPIHSEY